jgi:ribosomal protein S18 acetylase RimI-like enzyme
MDITAAKGSGVRIEELRDDAGPEVRAEARELLLEYGQFVISQPGTARFCYGSLEKEADRLPLSYQEQGGGCLIARFDEAAVGFVAWRSVSTSVAPEAWELKRLWVRPQGRGLRTGRALTQAVLDRAIAARRGAVYLDTVPETMAVAHRLYLDMGFEPCERYNDNPVDGIAYLVKYL